MWRQLRQRRPSIRTHVTDKTKALARDGAQQTLVPACIPDRLAHGIDAAGQRRLRDDAAIPHLLEQLILADDALAMLEQIEQQIENLGLKRHALSSAAELPPLGIKYMIFKAKSHR